MSEHSGVEGMDPRPIHFAVVVSDLDAAAAAWSQVLGRRPDAEFTTLPEEESQTRYKGASTPAQVRMALFDFDGFQIELAQPIDTGHPSAWADGVGRRGDALHHVAFRVEGMERAITSFEEMGMPVVQRAEFEGGRYAYVGSEEHLGAMVELLEFD